MESLACFEARPGLGEPDSAIANGAWNFNRINQLYGKCLKVLEERPLQNTTKDNETHPLQQWFRREQAAWEEAVSADPLLPTVLLPVGYLGKTVWQIRATVLPQARKRLW